MIKAAALYILISPLALLTFVQTDVEWETISEKDFSIEYPGDWEVNRSGLMGTSFLLLSPVTSEQDAFRENVNLVIQDLSNNSMNLDQFAELSASQIETMMVDGKLIVNERIQGDDQPFQKVIYSGNQGDFTLKFEQYYWVIKNKAYILTFTSEIGQFDSYRKTAERILDSFKLN